MTNETAPPLETLANLVEAHVEINTVASFAGISAAPNELPSDAVGLVAAIVDGLSGENNNNAELLGRLKLWAKAVKTAHYHGPEFVRWVARHVLEIPGSADEVLSLLEDIKKWVRATLRVEVPSHYFHAIAYDLPDDFFCCPDELYGVRPFKSDMSLKTVMKLNAEWHNAVAAVMEGSDFPAPWLKPGLAGPFSVVPITSDTELYLVGHAVRAWFPGCRSETNVHQGYAYYYSVLVGDKRLATAELLREGEAVELGKLYGFCDAHTFNAIRSALVSWLESNRGAYVLPVLLDDEVPF